MPHRTKLNQELGVVVIRYHGKIDLHEFRTVLDELTKLPGFRPGLKLVGDLRAAETALTGDEIRVLADYAAPTHRACGTTRWAFIASTALTYGLARMYAALTQGAEVEVQVFKEANEVGDWLALGRAGEKLLAHPPRFAAERR
jgi:hypothetical protein